MGSMKTEWISIKLLFFLGGGGVATEQLQCGWSGLWQEMGVARPVKCQPLIADTPPEGRLPLKQTREVNHAGGKVPPPTPTCATLIGSARVNQSYPERRQQQRHTGAEEGVGDEERSPPPGKNTRSP